MILPQIIELKSTNCQELEEGKVMMPAIVNAAGNWPDQFLGDGVTALLLHHLMTFGSDFTSLKAL
jgi:hypothetical protein